jgi:deoxyribose-phosphate aldolase
MTNRELLNRIDHTLLKATASWEEIKILCDEAVRFDTASVCIPPSYVKPVYEEYGPKPVICTVIGFPLGYSITAAKALETEMAVRSGAAEIDMVINIGDIKSGHFDFALEEIKIVRKACTGKILKVIIETCYLTDDEKRAACELSRKAGAAYVKTSSGFGTRGATVEDIRLIREVVGDSMKIKASTDINTHEVAKRMVEAGAVRLGLSRIKQIVTGDPNAVSASTENKPYKG